MAKQKKCIGQIIGDGSGGGDGYQSFMLFPVLPSSQHQPGQTHHAGSSLAWDILITKEILRVWGALCQEMETKLFCFILFFYIMTPNLAPLPTLSTRATRSRRRREKLPERAAILELWRTLDYSGKLKNIDSCI